LTNSRIGSVPTMRTAGSRNPSASTKCECIGRLLHQIGSLIRRRTTTSSQQSGLIVAIYFFFQVTNLLGEIGLLLEQKWANVFLEFFLEYDHCTLEKCIAHSDDMLWYVPLIRIANSVYIGSEVPNFPFD
jgi:hypothetical protein